MVFVRWNGCLSNLKILQPPGKCWLSQVVFASFVYKQTILGLSFPWHSAAGWDIYPLERKQILDTINQYNIKNMVVLSGDIHVAMAFDIPNGVTTLTILLPVKVLQV
jgi:phosphodiesterase/alkaline phosphatase D-like protein